MKGWRHHTGSKEDMRQKMEILNRYIGQETAQTVMESIVALVGDQYTAGMNFNRWPAVVSHIIYKETMCCTDRMVWSAFCFHNNIPFGMMVAYPHHRGMLRNENAYINLFSTWSDMCRDEMRSMQSMRIQDLSVSRNEI